MVSLAVAALLCGVGTYLVLQRLLTRIIMGLALISHGVNLLIMLSGGPIGAAPVLVPGVDQADVADPLPAAMVLTAIVITFGMTALLLALGLRSWLLTGDDTVEDDIEDRRLAREDPSDDSVLPDSAAK